MENRFMSESNAIAWAHLLADESNCNMFVGQDVNTKEFHVMGVHPETQDSSEDLEGNPIFGEDQFTSILTIRPENG